MAPNVTEESAPREGGAKLSGQIEGKPSGGGRDYGDRVGQMDRERGQRQGYDRRFIREGERSASLERAPMEMKSERPYGPPRGFYRGPRPDRRDMPCGYGRERMFDQGIMGRPDFGWLNRRAHERDFSRFPPEGRRDFGGYNHGYGEPFCPPYRPEQWGYGDRYPGGHDRSRRGDYYGMGPTSRRGYSCAPPGYRYGPRGSFQPLPKPRPGYPGC